MALNVLALAATMTIAYCDLDHDLSKFSRADADFVGLIDVDWHAKRSGGVAQAEALAEKYGYVSSYSTDHFICETPDEQHGVAILSHEVPKSRQIVKLPSTGKGKVFFVCEFTDCYVGVAEFDPACRDESLSIVSNAVASLRAGKPFYMADRDRSVQVRDPVLPEPAVVPRPAEMKMLPGLRAVHVRDITDRDIVRSQDGSLPPEGYRLSVRKDGISVASADDAGAFYAVRTLRQLAVRRWGALYLPCCEIADGPRFAWRGLMMDEARHFYGKDAVKRMLDVMADYKLNVFHWHLSDDEGWRLPVEGIPPSSGSYTREDIREIAAFAKARHIRIVPEVDLPGHARALVHARPDLSCFPDGVGVPANGVDNVVCPGKDSTVAFLRSLVASLAELFPDSEYIHLGGDEANKVNWTACPHCRARMAAVGAKNVSELQAWLTRELASAVAQNGRRMVGWTEILYGGMAPENTVLMSWLGAEGGIAAAKAGRDSVMCPHEWCYFNYEQCLEDDPFEYPWWSVPLSLERAYAYDPLAGMPEEARKHVLGGQCCLWSNQIHSEPELHWKAWPRACATAEIFWSPAKVRDYSDFRRRMTLARKRLVSRRINAAPLPEDVALSEESGFVSLFNGRDLAGWEGATSVFGVDPNEPGVLQCLPGTTFLEDGRRANLVTEKEYKDFVLRFEFKMPKNGNNGVGIRMSDVYKNASYDAMCELQLLDDGGDAYYDVANRKDKLKSYQYAGSVYGIAPSLRDNPRGDPYAGGGSYMHKAGLWNHAEITVVGSKIEMRLNGQVVVQADVSLYRGDGDTLDGRPHPGLHNEKGRIGWLGHDDNVKWRNIRIKEFQ